MWPATAGCARHLGLDLGGPLGEESIGTRHVLLKVDPRRRVPQPVLQPAGEPAHCTVSARGRRCGRKDGGLAKATCPGEPECMLAEWKFGAVGGSYPISTISTSDVFSFSLRPRSAGERCGLVHAHIVGAPPEPSRPTVCCGTCFTPRAACRRAGRPTPRGNTAPSHHRSAAC